MARNPRQVKVLPVCHPKGCRSYVVVDPASKEACVVDPLLDQVAETIRLLGEEGARLRWIVDTHAHADHLSGAARLRARTDAEVVMHPAADSDVATRRAAAGEPLPLGEQALTIHHAPGNTADALVVEASGTLFTGDTLLIGTVGLSDAPGADPETWFETLRTLFADRADDTVLHPGHDDMGRTATTLKQERTGNGWLREDDLEAFLDRFHADERATCADAAQILEANRAGLTRVPRDLEAASGLLDPAHATESALRRQAGLEDDEPAAPADRPPGAREVLMLGGGAAVVLATIAGWLLGVPAIHAISALVGAAFVGVALGRSPSRRRRKEGPSLFYEGPQRKGIGE